MLKCEGITRMQKGGMYLHVDTITMGLFMRWMNFSINLDGIIIERNVKISALNDVVVALAPKGMVVLEQVRRMIC